MKETSIEEFIVTCKNCDRQKKQHKTQVYVDWKKKYYMIICYECGTAEAFNEFGKKIEPEKKN